MQQERIWSARERRITLYKSDQQQQQQQHQQKQQLKIYIKKKDPAAWWFGQNVWLSVESEYVSFVGPGRFDVN